MKEGQQRQARQDKTISVVGCFNNYEGEKGFVVEVPQSVSSRFPVFLLLSAQLLAKVSFSILAEGILWHSRAHQAMWRT